MKNIKFIFNLLTFSFLALCLIAYSVMAINVVSSTANAMTLDNSAPPVVKCEEKLAKIKKQVRKNSRKKRSKRAKARNAVILKILTKGTHGFDCPHPIVS